MMGSSKDIEAHAATWTRWRVNWYGVLQVAIAQSIFYLIIVGALTVIASTI